MIAVREEHLPNFVPCDFVCGVTSEADLKRAHPHHLRPVLTVTEIFVPQAPVKVPEIQRLNGSQALVEARAEVARALQELREAERALEQQLADLRKFMDRRTVVEGPRQVHQEPVFAAAA